MNRSGLAGMLLISSTAYALDVLNDDSLANERVTDQQTAAVASAAQSIEPRVMVNSGPDVLDDAIRTDDRERVMRPKPGLLPDALDPRLAQMILEHLGFRR